MTNSLTRIKVFLNQGKSHQGKSHQNYRWQKSIWMDIFIF